MTTKPARVFPEVATLIDRSPPGVEVGMSGAEASATVETSAPVLPPAPVASSPDSRTLRGGEVAPVGTRSSDPRDPGSGARFIDAATIMDRPPVTTGTPAEPATTPMRALPPADRFAAPVMGTPVPRALSAAAAASHPTLNSEARPAGSARFLDAGTIQERLEDEDALLRRFDGDPGDPFAGDQLDALYARRGEHEARVGLLLDRAEVAAAPDERAGLLLRAARIYRAELSDAASARLVLVTALRAVPGDHRIHDELDTVVCTSGEFAAARDAYADAAQALDRAGGADPRVVGELWLRVASLHIMDRGAPAAVTAALSRVLALDPERAQPILELCHRLTDDLVVVDALVDLHQRLSDPAGAKRVLTLSIDRAVDPDDRARRHHAIADLAIAGGDDLEAEWHLAEAVRLAPARSASRTLLADLYRRRGEPRRAARLLEDARHQIANPVDRANLACQAAAIYADELGEGTRAVNLYEMVIASDPERAEAAAPLAERYWERGCYAELEPLIDVLVRRAASSGDEQRAAELCYRAGRTALELGKHEQAVTYLESTLAVDPDHPLALRAMARASRATGQIERAYRAQQRVLEVAEHSGASDSERADLLAELAELAEECGDRSGALDLHADALARSPAHEQSLAGAARLLRARGDLLPLGTLLAKAAGAAPRDARARILTELAELQARDLGDPSAAVRTYRQALEVSPGDRGALAGLAELYVAAESWREAVDALVELAEVEAPGFRRGRYLQVAAQLARGRLDESETATLFARALDELFAGGEPTGSARAQALRAFADLESLLRGSGAYKALERAYRTMIKRLDPHAPELADLWTRLGALYREELDQPQAAIESYEIAATLAGEGGGCDRVLIDLYEGFAPDQIGKLAARRQRLVKAEPMAADNYRALVSLYQRSGERDRAFLALRALVALGAARPDEQDEVARLERVRPAWPRGPLAPVHHARLRHPDEDVRITGILAAVCDPLIGELAVPMRRLGLRNDTSPAWQPLRDLAAAVAGLLGVAAPPMIVSPEVDADLSWAAVLRGGRATLALVAGRRMASASRAQTIHDLARLLGYARPASAVRQLLVRPGGLDAALDAGLMVGGYRGAGFAPGPAARRLAGTLDRTLAPAMRAHLATLVQTLEPSRDAIDVERWGEAIDATCRRGALLLCGDLTVAIAALGRALPRDARARRHAALADLLAHSCGDDHALLRVELGLTVG